MSETIEVRVARGVALLDDELPDWWRDDRPYPINVDRLNLESGCDCVLGQTWDGDAALGDQFWRHADRLFGSEAVFGMPQHYGFNALDDESKAEYADLTAEWKRVIDDRRGGGS